MKPKRTNSVSDRQPRSIARGACRTSSIIMAPMEAPVGMSGTAKKSGSESFVRRLPPSEQWQRAGRMEKKTLSSKATPKSDGILWLQRHAVASRSRLMFVRSDLDSDVIDSIPLNEVTLVELEEVFVADGPLSATSAGNPADNNAVVGLGPGQDSFRVRRDADDGWTEFHLIIGTDISGHNFGRRYVHRVPPDEAQGWLKTLTELVEAAKTQAFTDALKAQHGHRTLSYYRAHALRLYESDHFQYCVATLILMGFMTDIGEAQMLPEAGTTRDSQFLAIESFLTVAFTLELGFNLFTKSDDCFRPFFGSLMNCFDLLVVFASVSSLLLRVSNSRAETPSLKTFRLIRVVRVLRLFRRLQSLNRIMRAISKSLWPLFNSLLVLLLFTSVYAIMATHVFAERSPEYFGNFSMSFFTMIQVVSGDGWVSNVSREIFENREEAEMDAQVLHLHMHMCTHAYMRVCMNVYVSMYTVRKFVPRWTSRSPSFSAATTLWLRWSS